MRRTAVALGLTASTAVAALLSASAYAQRKAAAPAPTSYVVLVKSADPSSTAAAAAAVAARGTVVGQFGAIGVVTAASADPDFASAIGADANVQAVAADPAIQWIPNETVVDAGTVKTSGATANTEPDADLQWALRAIHADETAAAGDRGNSAVRARVAVLDSGIVTTHEDIAPNLNLSLSRSFVPGENLDPPAGVFNHGTHVAGIIAAPINGKGIQGVAPEAEIVAVKVLNAAGSGSFSWLIPAIEYASGPQVHADVINMSLGATFDRINAGGGGAGTLIAALNRAINHATANGTLVVSAAGNEAVDLNSRLWSIPAQSGNGIAISATAPFAWAKDPSHASFDHFASYSNYGQSVIDLAAPGGDAAYPGTDSCTIGAFTRPCWVFDLVIAPGGQKNAYYFAAGTSMAAPHVSGLAALIVGKYGHMSPTALVSRMTQAADDIFTAGNDNLSGKGRINAVKALR